MRRCDFTDVIVIARRHVGGILNVNKVELKCGKSYHSCTEIIRKTVHVDC